MAFTRLGLNDPEQSDKPVPLITAALLGSLTISISTIVLFTWIADEMREGDTVRFDDAVRNFVHSFASPGLTHFMFGMSFMGAAGMIVLLVLAIGLFAWKKWWRGIGWLLITMVGASILDITLKHGFHRARPEPFFGVLPHTYSFPSGHSLFSFCFYGVLAGLINARIRSWWLDRKVSELLAGRKIDQDSKLIRIYTEAASILNGSITSAAVRELIRLRYDLFELRQSWRGEIHHLIKVARLPDKSALHPTSWYRRGNRENKSLQTLGEIADKVRNLRLALITGAYIAQASGTTRDFVVNELPSERPFWNPVAGDMQELLTAFRREKTKAQLSTLSAALGGYTAVLDGTAGCSTAEKTVHGAALLVSS